MLVSYVANFFVHPIHEHEHYVDLRIVAPSSIRRSITPRGSPRDIPLSAQRSPGNSRLKCGMICSNIPKDRWSEIPLQVPRLLGLDMQSPSARCHSPRCTS